MGLALIANRCKPADYVRTPYHITPEPDVTPEDLLKREYWVHVSKNLRAGDKLEISAEDRSWYAEAVVRDADRHGAAIAYVLGPIAFEKAAKKEAAAADFVPEWGGPSQKWRVRRTSDNEIIKKDFENKQSAENYITSHVQAMAA